MGYVSQYIAALSTLVADLWVWFLIGFLAAGVVAEFVPRSFIARHFGNNDVTSLLKAALSGLAATISRAAEVWISDFTGIYLPSRWKC